MAERTRTRSRSTVMAALLVSPIAFLTMTSAAASADTAGSPLAQTEVTTLSTEATDGTLQVSGAATFGGQAPVLVGEDPTGDTPIDPTLTEPLGLDVTELAIHQPDPNTPEIDFIIRVTQLDREPPPEIIRYLWQFTVDEQEYWIQAKTSDLTTGTVLLDDPQGAVQHIPGSFRLRGDCGPMEVAGVETNIQTCSHVAWLDGVFDTDANEIRMTVPLDKPTSPELVTGATIEPEEGVTASIQAGVSNAGTSDTALHEFEYPIPTKDAQLGIAPAGTDPALVDFDAEATVAADDSFTGELDVTSMAPGDYEVFAQACFADNCGIGTIPFTVQ